MIRIISTTLLFFFILSAQGQINKNKGSGKITGVVLDELTSKPVEFATVSLTDIEKNKLIDGVLTDENGKFQLSNLPAGKYKISIKFISYKDAEQGPIEVTDLENEVNLGKLTLAPDTKQLKEVVVEGQKTIIEEKVDRIVYNAENDATSKGGDATDVMKKVPLLSVDMDGNVSLRGNQNIKILINNRPSTLSAGSVADALKQIPADLIKSVEVITAPSSKYDAEGSAGIININLKKNSLEGLFLNVDAGVGFRGSNLGLNGNMNKKKFRISLGGFGRAGYNIPGHFANEQITKNSSGTSTRSTQEANTRNEMMFGRYTLGIDYDINEHNFLSSSFQYGLRNNWNYQDGLLTQNYANNSFLNQNRRNVEVKDLSGTFDASLNYTHTFKKPQHEFSILTLYSQNDRQNDFKNSILDSIISDKINSQLKNVNNSKNQEITVQFDYTQPISKTQTLELGTKNITRMVSSEYQYLFATGNNGNFVPNLNANLSNTFNYNQNVTAGYASYTLSFLKVFNLKAGGRYEYTTIDANFKDGTKSNIPSYPVFVPSINISRRFKNGNMIKASFTRRIQRPSIQFLNPNLQNSNPLSITVGNPTLSPEYTNNYELSYSTNIKKTFLNFSTFVRNTSGAIQSVREVQSDNIIKTTYQNIGSEDAYGVNVFANVNLSNNFSLSGGTDAFYAVLNNNVSDPIYKAHNEGFVVSGRIFANYNLPKDWGLQLFGFYRGNQVQLQGYQTGFGFYSLSVKKDFNEKKGSIGFGAENFLTPQITIKNQLNSPVIDQTSSNLMNYLSFRVNFSYKIGKVSTDTRQRKSLQNDDLKQEGGENGGGGMPSSGQGGPPSGGGQGGSRPQGGGFPQGKKGGSQPQNLKTDSIPTGFDPKNLPKDFDPKKFRPGSLPQDLYQPKNDSIPNNQRPSNNKPN